MKVVAARGASREVLNPQFNQEVWVPASFPAMSKHVLQGVWDHDWGPGDDDVVATFTSDVKLLEAFVKRGHKTMGPAWRNVRFYNKRPPLLSTRPS